LVPTLCNPSFKDVAALSERLGKGESSTLYILENPE
jgi:hypothetical protein